MRLADAVDCIHDVTVSPLKKAWNYATGKSRLESRGIERSDIADLITPLAIVFGAVAGGASAGIQHMPSLLLIIPAAPIAFLQFNSMLEASRHDREAEVEAKSLIDRVSGRSPR